VTTDEGKGTESLLKYADLLLKKGMQEEAGLQLQEVLRRDPECARAHYLLAVVRMAEGSLDQAASHFQDALAVHPGEVKTLNGLGVVLQRMGQIEPAGACYREAVRIDPCYLDAQINLAILLKDHGRLCAAERLLKTALTHLPDAVRLRYNLANVLHLQGRSLDAVSAYRETLALDPEHLDARQNLLFALHYAPQISDRHIFAEHLAAVGTRAFTPASSQSDPLEPSTRSARIRIGYLSPDFRSHAVASFIEPILSHHDKSRFEIFCYANLSRPDRTTERLKVLCEGWRDICAVGDEEAAKIIAADRLDILVDLAGHTAGNRLPLLARKPAPLQATWIGYPDTTGMPELDFRITDELADPPGTTERFHSERLIRLPRSFCCYLPEGSSPAVAALPCLESGRITFGSFNNLAKVTPEVIALWSRVLQAVPGSRMLMKCRPFADDEVCARIMESFAGEGVAAERIELHPGDAAPADHLAQYGRVDIALDTFPYNGTTTSCEALWMGVPVVTLAGTRHAARTGVSILTNCGLATLVAQSLEEYVAIACELARDTAALQRLRAGLRERVSLSPLTDGKGVTRELEAAFMGMLQSRKDTPSLPRLS
jgi:protein O-GlcNAc transferase